ncbi:hypothetical protein EW445_18055 [Salmonella enterica subsp. enterica serovar Newport]|uniref:Fimbrial protein n=1 Tax=Salmonella enterica subsp. salamae TaxID=59202 RepID=A0A5Y3N1J9_SALER|nr:hypothetical protein [Salmonella enterica subsp. enterica serovar Newport]ECI4012536.1 hypothetical protein [Salmonella enterica subsp. salamae]
MTACFHCVAARVTVLSVLLFSAPVFAVTTCAYEGDLTYTYTLSGTSDNVQMSASGGYDRGQSSAQGYAWYYPRVLHPCTVQNGSVSIAVREGVDFVFTPILGDWDTRVMNGWNTWRKGSIQTCNSIGWGVNDWTRIVGNPRVNVSPTSLLAGYVEFSREPLLRVYAVLESSPTVSPVSLPGKPTSTIYLSGSVQFVNNCSVSPASLDIDLNTVSPSVKEKKITRVVSVTCQSAVTGNVYIGGKKVDVGEIMDIPSATDNVIFYIRVNKNDFVTESANGVLELEGGVRLISPVVSGVYSGITYLDLRFD